MDFVQITTTTETAAEARKIADHLVEQRLAACVQVMGPITSTYRWQGSVERAEEFMCFVKTRCAMAAKVEAAIVSLHSYENPEIVVTPIEGGSSDYLAWVASETTPDP
ncbi:MAG TPA: divalent-cation tolerance protein CutA [Actinomycetota bacterium]|nr:divalent-cation tolerance protein CutA [Actinomycetota bacterium]